MGRLYYSFQSTYSLLAKTNTAKPAKSLVKSICYPEAHNFSTAATWWGSEHEVRAHRAYHIEINQFHESLTISDSGSKVAILRSFS